MVAFETLPQMISTPTNTRQSCVNELERTSVIVRTLSPSDLPDAPRHCLHCKTELVISTRTEMSKQKKFCNDHCRITFHYERRKEEILADPRRPGWMEKAKANLKARRARGKVQKQATV